MPARIHRANWPVRLAAGVAALILLTLTGCNSAGSSGSSSQGNTPSDPPALAITTGGTLPSGQQGAAYLFNFTETGGTAPYTWSVAGGTLAPGLTLAASTGALSGMPTQSGSFSFTVQVQDSGGKSAQAAFSLGIASPLKVTANSLAQEVVGVAYTGSLQAAGGTAPYTFQLGSGQIPPGLALGSAGVISGTPTTAGAYSVSFKVTDSSNPPLTALAPLSFNVVEPLTIALASLPAGAPSTSYSAFLAAQGGTAPYTWSLSGPLPPGLSLASSGQISGTPTTTGQYSFSVKVVDSSIIPQTAIGSYQITVASSIVIQTATLPGGMVGSSYSSLLQASGGTLPYSWSIDSGQLPPGMGLSASGQLTGAPSTSGQYSFTVQVSDSSSAAKTARGRFGLWIGEPLKISQSALPNATLQSAYNATLTASGGTSPYTWTIASGALPAGLSLASTGQISGTPTATGQYSFTAQVVDSSSNPQTATATFSLTVVPSVASLAIQTTGLPSGTVGVSYSASLQASGGTTPYSWSLSSGQLPPGLSLATNGAIAGYPSATGQYAFSVRVQDSSATPQAATASFSITIAAAPLAIATTSLAQARAQITYSATLQATGGTTPYSWSISSGQFPPGLGLATNGQISGAASSSGTFSFTVKVQDSASTPQTATASLSIAVAPAPLAVATVSLAQATAGVSYSASLQASGGTTPYSWSLSSGQLPAGLSLAASGQISGTPTVAGTYTFTVKVTDSSSTVQSATASLSIVVAPPPLAVTTNSLPSATVGVAYSASLQATGGMTPYTWSLTTGQLPVGLSMTTAGQISGTPSTGGQYNATFQVQDSSPAPQTASVSLSITVAAPALAITTSSLSAGAVGSSYSATLQASGGTAPYTWSVSSGQLPAGLTLGAGGQISGTPTATGTSSFTAKVTDSSSPVQTATTPLSISVSAAGVTVVPGSIDFGNVANGQTATQSVKLTNSGAATLTISQASVTGSEFSMNGLTLPLNLAAGQSVYFNVAFTPTSAGSATGSISITSNDPSSPTNIALSGTCHWVTLNWTASTSTVVGYYVFRATVSGGTYTQLNSTPVSGTSFDDTTVSPGQTYYYVVTAVDSNSVQSVYSNQASAAVPSP